MRQFVAVGFAVALSSWADAQNLRAAPVSYPALPRVAPNAQAFVSPGWAIVSEARGDLNGDGRPDFALALWPENAAKAGQYDSNQSWPFYRLIIAFAQPSGGYKLMTDNKTLIEPPASSGAYEDPLGADDLRIVHGSLDISRQLLRGHVRYRFRWSGNAFTLIGYDYADSDGHCVTMTSINFLTRRARIEVEALSEDGGARKASLSTKGRALPTLEQVSSEDFYPESSIRGRIPEC